MNKVLEEQPTEEQPTVESTNSDSTHIHPKQDPIQEITTALIEELEKRYFLEAKKPGWLV